MSSPVLSGYKWANLNVSISFMPDGTPYPPTASASNLFATYDPKYPREVWQGEILKAAQYWMNACGLTFSVVPDDGSPVGAAGKDQGDPRFGDIRIGADPTLLSLDHTYFPFHGNTMGGDMMFTGGGPLNIGSNPDLFSLALHNFGISCGVSETNPLPSVLNSNGPFTGLYPIDVAAAQEMYGPPPVPDTRPPVWVGPPSPIPVPGPVSPLTGSIAVTLSWKEASGADGYQVEKSGDGQHFVFLAKTANVSLTDVFHRGPYVWYRVRAFNSSGLGPGVVIKV